jgi:hypothetical protein
MESSTDPRDSRRKSGRLSAYYWRASSLAKHQPRNTLWLKQNCGVSGGGSNGFSMSASSPWALSDVVKSWAAGAGACSVSRPGSFDDVDQNMEAVVDRASQA